MTPVVTCHAMLSTMQGRPEAKAKARLQLRGGALWPLAKRHLQMPTVVAQWRLHWLDGNQNAPFILPSSLAPKRNILGYWAQYFGLRSLFALQESGSSWSAVADVAETAEAGHATGSNESFRKWSISLVHHKCKFIQLRKGFKYRSGVFCWSLFGPVGTSNWLDTSHSKLKPNWLAASRLMNPLDETLLDTAGLQRRVAQLVEPWHFMTGQDDRRYILEST